MACCAVSTCKNNMKKNPNFSFHCFPKDKDLRKLWIGKCSRGDPINVNYARICSEHFTPDDFIRDLQSELLQLNRRPKLKRDAVPTLKLLHSKDESFKDRFKRETRCKAREIRKRAIENLQNLSVLKETCDQSTSTADLVDKQQTALLKEIEKLKKDRNRAVENLRKSMLQLSILRQSIVSIQKSVAVKRQQLSLATQGERNGVKNKGQNDLQFRMRAHQVFGKVFTVSQLRCLLNNGKRVNWSSADIASAVSLRDISKPAYYYLRNKGYPLPSKTTLLRWKQSLKNSNSKPDNSQPKKAEVPISENKEVDAQCELLKKDGLID